MSVSLDHFRFYSGFSRGKHVLQFEEITAANNLEMIAENYVLGKLRKTMHIGTFVNFVHVAM